MLSHEPTTVMVSVETTRGMPIEKATLAAMSFESRAPRYSWPLAPVKEHAVLLGMALGASGDSSECLDSHKMHLVSAGLKYRLSPPQELFAAHAQLIFCRMRIAY